MSDGTISRPNRFGWALSTVRTETILAWTVTLALLILIGAPLLMVILQAFWPGLLVGDYSLVGPGTLLQVFERPFWRVSLTNSLMLSLGTMVLGTAIGCSLAIMRQSSRFFGRRALDLSVWILLIIPSFVIAQGWILFAGRSGLANQWFGMTFIGEFIFSPPGLITVMSLKNIPFAYLAVNSAMRWDVSNYTNAARLCGASPARVFATVRVRLLLPAVLSGALLVFVDTIGDFGLPAALATSYRFPTLTYSIFVAISQSPIRFDLAGVLSFYLVALIGLAVAINLRLVSGPMYAFLTANAREREAPQSRFAWLYSLISFAFIFFALILPIGTSSVVSFVRDLSTGPTPGNLTLEYYRQILRVGSPFIEGLANSLRIAVASGLVALVIGFVATFTLSFVRFRLNWAINLISTVTLAVPGVILGVGYIFFWNQPLMDRLGLNIYGRPIILVLAAVAGSVPLAVRTMMGAFAQVPESFLSAAAMQGATLSRRVTTILIPITASALLAAGLAAFGSNVFDLAISSILRPPQFSVLPVVINREFQQGFFGTSTAATFVGTICTVGIILVVDSLVRRFVLRRIGR